MGDDKAAHILDAAEKLLVTFGYRKVTVDDVARRAGIGKGTVYLYWPSKRELFGSVLTREAARLLAEQTAAGQVIYTTHSAACLPEDLGLSVRVVEPDQNLARPYFVAVTYIQLTNNTARWVLNLL